jgi:4-amino-4-deoxy-L-arabinose transferase-like glycosyltransferase
LLRKNTLVAVVWLCFLARGCFYCALLPIWEGYDEPFHFTFVQYVAAHRSLPVRSDPVSREVQASLHLLPLSWQQRLHAMDPPIYTQDSYWQLPEAERQALQEQVRAIPPAWGSESGTAPAMYEAQQAPLYYWVMSVPLRLASQWSLPARVLLIRILSVLLASLCIPIAYLAARKFFTSEPIGLGVIALITCMPELMIDISRAGNECLAVPLYTLLTLLLLLSVEPGGSGGLIAAGAVLGLGLLTKAYFLVAVPAFLLLAVYAAWRAPAEQKRVLLRGALGFSLALLVSVGWYWRNRILTGTWSGEENDAAAVHSTVGLLASMRHVHWSGGITSVLVSHVWFGGWSFLKLPKPLYVLFALGMVLVACGLVRVVMKGRLHSRPLVVAGVLYGLFWVGLLYNVFVVFLATGVSASDGWYMYAVVVPELLLVTCGLLAVTPQRWSKLVLPVLTAAFAAIDLYGVHTLLVPYYTGLIAHLPGSDVVNPARFQQLVTAGPQLILARQTVNKPAFVGPGTVAVFFMAYYLATVVAVGVAFVSAYKAETNACLPLTILGDPGSG